MERMRVAQQQLAELANQLLESRQLAVRELANRANLDPRTCRDALSGRGTSGWVTIETAESIMQALGELERMSELEVFVSA